MFLRPLSSAPICAMVLAAFALGGRSAEVPKAPVPKSPYLPVVYRYADALLKNGRDTYGRQKSGLFLSALDRTTLAPLTNRPAAQSGLSEDERVGRPNEPLQGANPQHDHNLLRLLYTLSELSGKAHYREAADGALKWFFEHTRSPATGLLPWGQRMSWDVVRDEPAPTGDTALHEFFRPWLLWDRCFAVAPEASQRFALGLWQHQIANQRTGAFDARAGYWQHQTREGQDSARHAGFYIRTWAVAHAHTNDPTFLKAVATVLERFERKRDPQSGLIEARSGHPDSWPISALSMAIDCDGAAHRMPEPLALRLRAFAAREDEVFCALAHDLKRTGGFVSEVNRAAGRARSHTPRWVRRDGGCTTAQVGMMCVSRYDNTGKVGYRELIIEAADVYSEALPPEDLDLGPAVLGHAISLQLAAWRHTASASYLETARKLADWAVERFFQTSALPRASLRTDHYESVTGADTLALALVELHLNVLHITAVRCPPNTADR